MTRLNPGKVQMHGDIGIQAGDYTFTWDGADGPVEVDARFTFHFRREAGGWKIVEHHSSAMPTAPPALKPVSGISSTCVLVFCVVLFSRRLTTNTQCASSFSTGG